MKQLTFILLIFFYGLSFSQILFNTSNYDLGEVNKEDKKYFDFTLTNAGKKTATITKFEEPYGIDVKFSSRTILPDSTIIVRIKYTPKRKGAFKKDVPIYIDVINYPVVLTIQGEAKSFDVNESLEAPDIVLKKNELIKKEQTKIYIKDAKTNQPVNEAIVEIIWDGLVYKNFKTSADGTIKLNLKPDNYYVVVRASGYGVAEQAVEITGANQEFTILLGEPGVEDTLVVEKLPVDTPKVEVIQSNEKDTVSTDELPVDLYAPNNIVFLIDVSVSMKQEGRLDLLKASMIELLNGLRPIDKLAIVTYASSTDVVLNSTYVRDKAKIQKIIQDLEAGGYTAGKKGVSKAFQVARDNFIKDGNNQVILATDGAFNFDKGDRGLLKVVENNYKKGIAISVLGIKNEKWTVKSMSQMAELGGGSYIHIKSYAQAKSVLLNEIKSKSRKK